MSIDLAAESILRLVMVPYGCSSLCRKGFTKVDITMSFGLLKISKMLMVFGGIG